MTKSDPFDGKTCPQQSLTLSMVEPNLKAKDGQEVRDLIRRMKKSYTLYRIQEKKVNNIV